MIEKGVDVEPRSSVCCGLLLTGLVLLSGCATPRSVYPPGTEEGLASRGVDIHDYQIVVEKMVTSMLKHGMKTEDGKVPVISLGAIYNQTPYNIEVRMIGEDIRAEVLRSGLAKFSTSTDYEKKGGESGDLYKQLEFQNESGHVDPATAKKYGQLVGSDYVLFGNIYSVERANERITEANFKFTLTLTEVRTGLAVWSDTQLIRKNIPRR
ncbi:MAG: penicillin-binding protein activator LpoB [Deltaproteobacteria bacterium]|nr:penicillin-binding protein activator LpoB [Deltaproteobacteria bacterium]